MELTAEGVLGVCLRAVPSMCSPADKRAVVEQKHVGKMRWPF